MATIDLFLDGGSTWHDMHSRKVSSDLFRNQIASLTLWSLFESGESKPAGGLLHLRWPFGLREVVETAVLPPVGGGTSSFRVRFLVAAAAASRNKVLPWSPPPRWCSTSAPAASLWRWCSRCRALVQELSASDSSIQREGEFVGF